MERHRIADNSGILDFNSYWRLPTWWALHELLSLLSSSHKPARRWHHFASEEIEIQKCCSTFPGSHTRWTGLDLAASWAVCLVSRHTKRKLPGVLVGLFVAATWAVSLSSPPFPSLRGPFAFGVVPGLPFVTQNASNEEVGKWRLIRTFVIKLGSKKRATKAYLVWVHGTVFWEDR